MINSFTQTAHDERCNFFGNIIVGKDISLKEIRDAYSAVVLVSSSILHGFRVFVYIVEVRPCGLLVSLTYGTNSLTTLLLFCIVNFRVLESKFRYNIFFFQFCELFPAVVFLIHFFPLIKQTYVEYQIVGL